MKEYRKLFYSSDPESESVISLLGGFKGLVVTFTKNQWKNLRKFYNFEVEENNILMEAAANRDLSREISRDGERLMGFLSEYLIKDECDDPVKFLAGLLEDAGYDIHGLSEWAGTRDEEEEPLS